MAEHLISAACKICTVDLKACTIYPLVLCSLESSVIFCSEIDAVMVSPAVSRGLWNLQELKPLAGFLPFPWQVNLPTGPWSCCSANWWMTLRPPAKPERVLPYLIYSGPNRAFLSLHLSARKGTKSAALVIKINHFPAPDKFFRKKKKTRACRWSSETNFEDYPGHGDLVYAFKCIR